MNNKILGVVIVALLGVIGYQNGYLDKLFHKGINCSHNNIKLTASKLVKQRWDLIMGSQASKELGDFNTKSINIASIATKSHNAKTNTYQCQGTADIQGTFHANEPLPNVDNTEKVILGLLWGKQQVKHLGKDQFTISLPITYDVTPTDDGKNAYVDVKIIRTGV